jgi:hypothetical protein
MSIISLFEFGFGHIDEMVFSSRDIGIYLGFTKIGLELQDEGIVLSRATKLIL